MIAQFDVIEVKNINIIGTRFTKIKNNNFLSFEDILNLNFFTRKNDIIKNGINIPTCLPKNIKG